MRKAARMVSCANNEDPDWYAHMHTGNWVCLVYILQVLRDIFCDFLFAYLHAYLLLERGLYLEEENCFTLE